MIHPAYPAARSAALRIQPLYDEHPAPPDADTIEAIINVAFWASLRREEGFTPRISLAFASPSEISLSPLVFEHPVPLHSQSLTRLAPAVERPGIHLCVSPVNGQLQVWGATRLLPDSSFVLEVIAPGLLVAKRSRGDDSAKFINVAVLQGDEIKVIDHDVAALPALPKILIALALSMRAHGRGGLLLVVPAGSRLWRESILHPIAYAVAPGFTALAELMRADAPEKPRHVWQESKRRLVADIGGLTAVDGATVITDAYEVLAFGAKIVRRSGQSQVDSVVVSEPVEGAEAALVEPGQLGGTRHLSAAQFAQDQRDCMALVASQDGRFTVFGWSAPDRMVRATRIESLLL